MKRMNKKILLGSCMAGIYGIARSLPVKASGIGGSKLATGTETLIQDATSWLLIIAPVTASLFIIYFCVRRGAADEMDQKKWNNRIVTAIVSAIGAVLGSAIINVVLGYYQ